MQHKIYKKVVLVILDGFGVASYSHGNAIGLANPETLNYMVQQFPSLTLQASGPLVGLPWGEVGNSEVGHLNIGAGRIVGQDLPRITSSIQDGSFFKNPAFLAASLHAKKNNSSLHLMGMVSSGGVHSFDEHLYALLAFAAEQGLEKVYIHMFTDGRDTAEKVAIDSVRQLRERIARIGVGTIATVAGRFYAMDRGKHWQQTEMAYAAMTRGIGSIAYTAEDAILDNYKQGVTDETIKPTVIVQDNPRGDKKPVAVVADNDAVIFFNFRTDRALQLTQAFVQPQVMDIAEKHEPLKNLFFVTMAEYLAGLPVHVAFPRMDLKNNLAEVVSKAGLTQFHVAESEKFAHVTSFFDCGTSEAYPGEERTIVDSPDNSKNYSDHPEMSALKVTGALVNKISSSEVNMYVCNFANADMVGHTGNLQAGIKAVQYLDRVLSKIMEASLAADAVLIITADHGNIEQMIDPKTGRIDKDHTTNPVPCLFIVNEFRFAKPKEQKNYISLSANVPAGAISDIAPTILDLLGLGKPSEMTGINLLETLDKE